VPGPLSRLHMTGVLIGIIAIADTLKQDAKLAIARLHEAGIETVMITGGQQADRSGHR